jgi:hypothetical protein
MAKKETKKYQFSELSETAKESAIENLAWINVEHYEWWEFVYDDAKNVGIVDHVVLWIKQRFRLKDLILFVV